MTQTEAQKRAKKKYRDKNRDRDRVYYRNKAKINYEKRRDDLINGNMYMEKRRISSKTYYENNKVKAKEYYLRNKDKILGKRQERRNMLKV